MAALRFRSPAELADHRHELEAAAAREARRPRMLARIQNARRIAMNFTALPPQRSPPSGDFSQPTIIARVALMSLTSTFSSLIQAPLTLSSVLLARSIPSRTASSNDLVEDDEELAGIVAQLEEQADSERLESASGDSIAAEFERYLKRRGLGG